MKNAIALGTFDGVHKGHKAVLTLPENCKKTAVIFDIPPKAIINGQSTSIMTPEDKISAIKKLGIDEIFTLDFLKIKDMSAEDFLIFIKNNFSPDYISCGYNYHFGKNATGNTAMLGDFCKQNGIEFICKEPVCENGEPVSSTKIREYLKNGECEKANSLLCFPFSFTAEVIKGDRRGRTLGFPTINQKYPECLIHLKFGVYKTKVIIENKEYEGITNIGIRPTYKTDYIISETYIKNFSGDLYGKSVKTVPYHFLRGEIKFSSLSELKKQLQIDITI